MDQRSPKEPPHLAGKPITLTARLEPVGDQPLDGPIVMIDHRSHGITLRIKDGILVAGVRQWGDQDTIVSAVDRLPATGADVGFTLAADGGITLTINGGKVAEGKAPGCIPVQPGRLIRATASHIRVGTVGRNIRSVLLEPGDAGAEFQGTLRDVQLRVG